MCVNSFLIPTGMEHGVEQPLFPAFAVAIVLYIYPPTAVHWVIPNAKKETAVVGDVCCSCRWRFGCNTYDEQKSTV